MIAINIKKEDVLKALEWINQHGVPKSRESRKYHLKYESRLYPPKYVISIANKFATGKELEADKFYGGSESNTFLTKLGFEVVEGKNSIIAKSKDRAVQIGTILFQSNEKYNNESRDKIIEKSIELCGSVANVMIFPGGTYKYKKITENSIKEVEDKIKKYINNIGQDNIICLGIDSDDGSDQIGIAISRKGIIAIGRKFHPAPGEEDNLIKAQTENEKEFGYNRTFEFQDRKYFLAVCYDGFGIKHKKLKNNGVSVIIDLIHAFYPKGEGGSGEVYFAKHGLAGASKEWDCPAFGAAVFFDRPIPQNWQSGVIWNKGNMSTQKWKYEDNPLKVQKIIQHDFKNENIEVRLYEI